MQAGGHRRCQRASRDLGRFIADVNTNLSQVGYQAKATNVTNIPYEGPEIIGYAQWPGRGTTYHFKLAGQDVELYITEKRKKLRVFIDYTEWTARRTTPPRSTREQA